MLCRPLFHKKNTNQKGRGNLKKTKMFFLKRGGQLEVGGQRVTKWPVTLRGGQLITKWPVTLRGGQLVTMWPVTLRGGQLIIQWPVT